MWRFFGEDKNPRKSLRVEALVDVIAQDRIVDSERPSSIVADKEDGPAALFGVIVFDGSVAEA